MAVLTSQAKILTAIILLMDPNLSLLSSVTLAVLYLGAPPLAHPDFGAFLGCQWFYCDALRQFRLCNVFQPSFSKPVPKPGIFSVLGSF